MRQKHIVFFGIVIMFIASISITFLVIDAEFKRTELDNIKAEYSTFRDIYEEGVAISVSNQNFVSDLKSLDANLKSSVDSGLMTSLEAEINIRAISWSLIQTIQRVIKYKEQFERFNESFESVFTYFWFDSVDDSFFIEQDFFISENPDFQFTYPGFIVILEGRLEELDWIPLFYVDIDTDLIYNIIDILYTEKISKLEDSISIQEVSVEIFSVCTIVLGLIVEVERKDQKIQIIITFISIWLIYISLLVIT